MEDFTMKHAYFSFIVVLLLFGLANPTMAAYWENSYGNQATIYQWPHNGTLGGLPETNPGHVLNSTPNPAYTYLDGPLFNSYLTFALGQSVTDLQVKITSSTPLNHNWLEPFDFTATGDGLSGSLLTSDTHFMLDLYGQGINYDIIDQFESPAEISFHVIFDSPVRVFAANFVGSDASALENFMGRIDYDYAEIIGDGVQFQPAIWVPEPSTFAVLMLGSLAIRRQRRRKQITG
jgi:hypothetical protein